MKYYGVASTSFACTNLRYNYVTKKIIISLISSVCGFQHFQRAGGQHVNLLEALYFVIVTFSTGKFFFFD